MNTRQYLKSKPFLNGVRSAVTAALALIAALALTATLVTLVVLQGAAFENQDGQFYFWTIFWFVVTLVAAVVSIFILVVTIGEKGGDLADIPTKKEVLFKIEQDDRDARYTIMRLEEQLEAKKEYLAALQELRETDKPPF